MYIKDCIYYRVTFMTNRGEEMFSFVLLVETLPKDVKFKNCVHLGLVALLQIEMVVLDPTLPLRDVIDSFQCTDAHINEASAEMCLNEVSSLFGNVYTTGILLFINMLTLKVRG